MKKITRILLIMILLSVSACGTKQEDEKQPETETAKTETIDLSVYNGEWKDEEGHILLIESPYVSFDNEKTELLKSDKNDYSYMFTVSDNMKYYLRFREDGSAELLSEDRIISLSLNTQSEEAATVEENTDKNKPNETVDPSEDKTEPVQPKGHWEERTVLVRDAWDEQVVVKEGWTEQILVKEGWTETYEECAEYTSDTRYYYVCRANGQKYYDSSVCAHECESSFYEATEYGEPYCVRYDTKTVNHPAEYNYIEHEPEYKTVHHEAEYKTETVWVED